MRARSNAGFTLIELMISVTLVAAIAAGMLSAMRGGLLTLERVQSHIQESRGALGLDQMIRSQIGGVLPVIGDCANEGQAVKSSLFRGTAAGMLMVTSYSMTEGARGYPRVVEYVVLPNGDGTMRLVADEVIFPSPATTLNFCAAPNLMRPLGPASRSMVLAPRLVFARISYREVDPATRLGGAWFPEWIKPNLPYAIRIEMEPGGSITVPLHVTRDYQEFYADRK